MAKRSRASKKKAVAAEKKVESKIITEKVKTAVAKQPEVPEETKPVETKEAAKKVEEKTVEKTVKKTSTKEKPKAETKATSAKRAKTTEKKVEKKTEVVEKKPEKTVKKTDISLTPEHFFEIDGAQISTSDIEKRILEAYKSEGHRIGNVKDLEIYYNFAERRAYYVINKKSNGSFVEF